MSGPGAVTADSTEEQAMSDMTVGARLQRLELAQVELAASMSKLEKGLSALLSHVDAVAKQVEAEAEQVAPAAVQAGSGVMLSYTAETLKDLQ